MQNKINKIISQISEKSERLCTKAERLIDVIELKSHTVLESTTPKHSNIGKYLYFAAAGLAVVGIVSEDARTISLTGAALSAGAGFLLSKRNPSKEQKLNTSVDMSAIKSQLTSETISTSKAIAAEWEEFISARQEEIKGFVSSLNVEDEKKEEMLSKLYYYETIKVSYPTINTIIEGMTMSNISVVKAKIISEITSAIKNATSMQIQSYNSLM